MSTPQDLPYGTGLTGANAVSWADAILGAIGAPSNPATVSSLTDWFAQEGGGGQNNPLNETYPYGGATGSINSAGVQGYSSAQQGVSATAQALQGSNYRAILGALQSGQGLIGNPSVSSELSLWSGGGYSSIGGVTGSGGGAAPSGSQPAGSNSAVTGTPQSATLTAALLSSTGPGGYSPITGIDPFSLIDTALHGIVSSLSTASDIPTILRDIGNTFVAFSTGLNKVYHAFLWLWNPSHWIRIIAFGGGLILIIPGAYALMKTGQGGQGDVTMALGILLTVLAGILFFIAFHNLPDDITNIKTLLGWIAEGVQSGKAPAA